MAKSSSFKKFTEAYTSAAVIVLNTLLLAAVGAGLYFGVDALRRRAAPQANNPVVPKYGLDTVASAYPQLSRDEVVALLDQVWSVPLQYRDFVYFAESPAAKPSVNVHEAGFRQNGEANVWPPDPEAFNVFVFGGSTTYGYGVADGDTVVSHLQTVLRQQGGDRVAVYNFGRAFYFSTQERILFEQLLMAGQRPDAVIFIDGLNDFYFADGSPHYAHQFRKVLEPGLDLSVDILGPDHSDAALLGQVVERYRQHVGLVSAIANDYAITPIFVWQPVPTYAYDLANHPFVERENELGGHLRSKYGYPLMAESVAADPLGDNFIWLADLQQDTPEPIYVDQVHYSAQMNQQLAEAIGQSIEERNLLKFVR